MKHPAALVREAPRWVVYSAVGALFLAVGMLTASLAGSAPGSGPEAVPRASGSAPRDPADATTQEERELRPGEVIATVRGDDVGLYGAPGSAEPVRLLPQWSHYGKPTTLLGISTATVDGQIWYQVKVPAEPNGSTGWVRAPQVDTSSTDLSIHVFLAEHVVLGTPVIIEARRPGQAPAAQAEPGATKPLS